MKAIFNQDKNHKARSAHQVNNSGSMSTGDLTRKTHLPTRPYATGSNDSAPSLRHGNLLEESASAKSAPISIPEGVKSDDEVNRTNSSSPSDFPSGAMDTSGRKNHNEHQPSHVINKLPHHQTLRPPVPNSRLREDSDPKTAPLRVDRAFQDALAQQNRNRSADRSAVESEDEASVGPKSSLSNQSAGSFFSNFRHHGSKAADGLGKAGKGFFGKFGRSGSSNEKEPLKPTVPSVIQRGIVEQTRITRIRKTMELARDKTEYWMPALPYRCIDYLNHVGVESEGLYRIPGALTEVRRLAEVFDTPPYDIDLLDERFMPRDLNVPASLLKMWMRDLPEPLLPREIQNDMMKKYPQAQQAPQALRDALSELPPHVYYLLFAVTCHISLLHAHQDTNKMNLDALHTCFQIATHIDTPLFDLLVLDWRSCWQGCWTEQKYLQEEEEEEARRAVMEAQGIAQPRMKGRTTSKPSSQPNSRPTTSRSPERRAPAQDRQGPAPERPSRPNVGLGPPDSGAQPFAQDLGGRMPTSRTQQPPQLAEIRPQDAMSL